MTVPTTPSARDRRQIIHDFVDRAFAGIDPGAPGAQIARGMRQLPPDAPDEPGAEQAQAWAELAALLADESFVRRVRQMALAGATGGEQPAYDPQPVIEHAGGAVAAGVAPGSPEGRRILDRIVDAGTPAEERARLAGQVETFTDRRVERYWELMGVLNGRAPYPSATPAFEWFAAALRAHG
ncbi:hypothetical protein AB0O34_17490 [Sphaerisporangium sp. NPDC088356]|uniref:hypothetical protein n=1 Tax=Sphaerisporangium sp. NPDC088356 TaxID=3154871 RepID=UPI00341B9130